MSKLRFSNDDIQNIQARQKVLKSKVHKHNDDQTKRILRINKEKYQYNK